MLCFALFSILLLNPTVHSASINRHDLTDYDEYEDSSEDFIEKDSCTVLVRIDSPPSSFFSHLPTYLAELSSVLNHTTTVARMDDFDQIFVDMNNHRKIITEEDSTSSNATFVEVLLETDLIECFNEEHLIYSIDQARNTFSNITAISSSIIQDPSTPLSPLVKIFLGIGGCILILSVLIVVVVTQTRRSPKKRTRTEYAATTITPDYDKIGSIVPLQRFDYAPAAKRPHLPPSFPPPPPPALIAQQSTTLHDLASGDGTILITDENRWMVNARDENGRTPLHCLAAASFDKKSPSQVISDCQVLIDNGANVNEQDNWGNTPLHVSIATLRISLSEMIVKEKSVDVTIVNRKEQTPLHIAASLNDFIVLDLLLAAPNAKKTLNITDFHNYTPLVANVRQCPGEVNFVRKLILAKADLNYPGDEVFDHSSDDNHNRERTALHYAAQFGMNEHVKILTEHGANVNAHDSRRRSPLHYAVENLKLSTVQLLVNIGADMGIHDNCDKTPVDLARDMRFKEALAIFDFEVTKNKEPANKKRRRRGKDENDKKRRRSSTDTGYKSGSPIEQLDEEREEIGETPSRTVQPRPTSHLFPPTLPGTQFDQFPAPPIPHTPQYNQFNGQYDYNQEYDLELYHTPQDQYNSDFQFFEQP